MLKDRLVSVAVGCLVVVGLSAACSSDSDDDGDPAKGGTAGKTGGSSGSKSMAGSASAGKGGSSTAGSGGTAGSSGTNHEGGVAGTGEAGRGDAGSAMGGEAGAPSSAAGAGGEGGASAGAGGEGGGGGEAVSCSTVRTELLGPIDAVSAGLVEDISAPAAADITIKVDASAGGYMAAATNPYIYVKLAGKSRAELTDLTADSSLDWDVALKRDNLRSNGGASGSGAAEVAILEGADFAAVTSAAVSTAIFGADAFIDAVTCDPITDAIGKPLTRFDGWYEYDGATMKLSPANRVYLIRDAHAATVYKLQIVGYYVDVSNGMGGTVSKSAVYTLRYAVL